MHPELSPEEQKTLIEVGSPMVRDLLNGKGRNRLVEALVKRGWSEQRALDVAEKFVENLTTSAQMTPEEEKWFEEVYEFVEEGLDKGKSKKKIVKELVKYDLDGEVAIDFVDNVIEDSKRLREERQKLAKKYVRHMVLGPLWVIVGIVVGVGAYSSSDSDMRFSLFFIAGVLILYGIVDLIWALSGLSKHK